MSFFDQKKKRKKVFYLIYLIYLIFEFLNLFALSSANKKKEEVSRKGGRKETISSGKSLDFSKMMETEVAMALMDYVPPRTRLALAHTSSQFRHVAQEMIQRKTRLLHSIGATRFSPNKVFRLRLMVLLLKAFTKFRETGVTTQGRRIFFNSSNLADVGATGLMPYQTGHCMCIQIVSQEDESKCPEVVAYLVPESGDYHVMVLGIATWYVSPSEISDLQPKWPLSPFVALITRFLKDEALMEQLWNV